eukprot:7968232-Alexandrium_andersonii.AAC.1
MVDGGGGGSDGGGGTMSGSWAWPSPEVLVTYGTSGVGGIGVEEFVVGWWDVGVYCCGDDVVRVMVVVGRGVSVVAGCAYEGAPVLAVVEGVVYVFVE